MSLDRRLFLKITAAGCLLPSLEMLTACTHQKFYNPDQDILIGGGQYRQNDDIHHVLAVVNLQQKETRQTELDFLIHSLCIDPKDKNLILVFERNGIGAAAIDIATQSIKAKLLPAKNHIFTGHGVFSPPTHSQQTAPLFSVEMDSDNFAGLISLRDSITFEQITSFPSFGSRPHDCRLIDEGNTLVVVNAGGDKQPGSLCYIDVKTQQLIERRPLHDQISDNKLPVGPQLAAAHFDIADDGSVIVATAPVDISAERSEVNDISRGSISQGSISMSTGGQPLQIRHEPEVITSKLFGEALSIAIDNKRNIAAVTHPQANLITFWSTTDRKLLKAISVPQPKGITLSLDERSYIINYSIDSSIVLIDSSKLEVDKNSIMQPSFISGEHIYNWSSILHQIMPAQVYS